MYKKIKLNNGINIVLKHMGGMESATIGLWVSAGSRNESERLSGMSHFLEHMIFKGTPTMSRQKIKEEIEGRGGSLNGFTSEEVTCYLAKVSSKHIDIAIDVLSDMVLNSHMIDKEIERERRVIIEEIKMYRDLPNQHVHDILSGMLWPGHSLGRPVIGNMKSVKSFTRKDIMGYKKVNYTPENITIVLCGNIAHTDAVARIKKIFSMRAGKDPDPFIEFKNNQNSPAMKILYKKTEQTHISMGLHSFGREHKDRYALSLLHIIMGANMSSRLFENVREKRGLAYEIGTEIKRLRDTGAFVVNAGIEHSKIKEAVSLVIKELKRVKDKPVPLKELKRAKEFFRVQLLLALENTMEHMLWIGDYAATLRKLPDKDDIIKNVNSISPAEVQRVAGSIFKRSNLNLAAIGPLKDKERDGIERVLDL